MTIIFQKLLFLPLISLFSCSRLPGNSNDILKQIAVGGVHKLRLLDEVGRWSKHANFWSTFIP